MPHVVCLADKMRMCNQSNFRIRMHENSLKFGMRIVESTLKPATVRASSFFRRSKLILNFACFCFGLLFAAFYLAPTLKKSQWKKAAISSDYGKELQNVQRTYYQNWNATTVTHARNVSKVRESKRRTSQPPINISKGNLNTTEDQHFKYIINENTLCHTKNGEPLDILVGVFSAPEEFNERNFIRYTWGTAAKFHPNLRLIFMLAISSKSRFVNSLLREESKQYNDIIQTDYLESYSKLMLKSFALFQWVDRFCSNAKYLLKIDSDARVNLVQLHHKILNKKVPNKIICGLMYENAPVLRTGIPKWSVSREEYPNNTYPTYCAGCAYIVPNRIVKKIAHMKVPDTVFPVDDVYMTGILRQQMNESIVSSIIKFETKKVKSERPYVKIDVL